MLFAENGNGIVKIQNEKREICKSENFGGKEIGKKGILGENEVRKIGDWETVKRKSMYDKRK